MAWGRFAPRWHEKQLTRRRPPNIDLFRLSTIVIIRRAVRFRSVSSAYRAQLPPASSTWQSVQFSPRDAENIPIVPMNSLTGIPLRSWTFLKTSSASCGRSAGAWAARRAPPHTPPHTPPNPRVAIAMAPATVPLNLLLARGASEELVVVLLLLRRAVVLHEIGARIVQTHLELH